MTEIRTRFAPSPTGMLHIGGFRGAVFSWMFAKHHGGKFILRIEDTDQERLVPGAIKAIVGAFQWFGLEIDEGPSREELKKVGEDWDGAPNLAGPYGAYIQSLRLPRYQEVAQQMVAAGTAYRCDCTAEMLEQERNEQMARKEVPGYSGYCRTRNVPATSKHVVRFKMPTKPEVSINDTIRGRVAWESISLKDPVLLKSDGFPTYHLAVVVDDHDMKITHALRGEEWLPSTPLHVLTYKALGWEMPAIGHLPLVLGPDGKKLSKRHGATSWEAFREQGYLPEALLNYIMRIGWSPGEGDNQEIFSKKDLIERFTLERVNPASGVFDYNKLAWMNGMYLRSMPRDEFLRQAKPWLENRGFALDQKKWEMIAPAVQERAKTFAELAPMVECLFTTNLQRDLHDMFNKQLDQPKALEALALVKAAFAGLTVIDHATVEAAINPVAEKLGVKPGAVFAAVRIAVLGKKATPPLADSICALGKDEAIKRIEDAIRLVENYQAPAAVAG